MSDSRHWELRGNSVTYGVFENMSRVMTFCVISAMLGVIFAAAKISLTFSRVRCPGYVNTKGLSRTSEYPETPVFVIFKICVFFQFTAGSHADHEPVVAIQYSKLFI
jgi:hypothetical protein